MGDNGKKLLLVFSALVVLGFGYLFYENNYSAGYSKTFEAAIKEKEVPKRNEEVETKKESENKVKSESVVQKEKDYAKKLENILANDLKVQGEVSFDDKLNIYYVSIKDDNFSTLMREVLGNIDIKKSNWAGKARLFEDLGKEMVSNLGAGYSIKVKDDNNNVIPDKIVLVVEDGKDKYNVTTADLDVKSNTLTHEQVEKLKETKQQLDNLNGEAYMNKMATLLNENIENYGGAYYDKEVKSLVVLPTSDEFKYTIMLVLKKDEKALSIWSDLTNMLLNKSKEVNKKYGSGYSFVVMNPMSEEAKYLLQIKDGKIIYNYADEHR